MIFTTNKKPKEIFPRGKRGQKEAIKRRYTAVKITEPLQRGGRPLSQIEKRARKEAGKNGPKGPGMNA